MAPELVLNRYHLAGVVRARGATTTYRALDEQTGETVGVLLVGVPPEPYHLVRAFRIGSQLSHPGLITYHRKFETEQHAGIVLDLVLGESLLVALGARSATRVLGVSQSRAFLALCDVVDYLHSQNLVHANLAPDTVIMASSDQVTLIDLGHCEELAAEKRFWHDGFHGTPLYSSPEHQLGCLTVESDYFAIGTLLFEYLTGANPFQGAHLSEILARIRTADVAQLDSRACALPRAQKECLASLLSLSLSTRRTGWRNLRALLSQADSMVR